MDSTTGLRDREGEGNWLPVEVGGESRPGWWVNSICSSGPSRPVETVASTIQKRATQVSVLLNQVLRPGPTSKSGKEVGKRRNTTKMKTELLRKCICAFDKIARQSNML